MQRLLSILVLLGLLAACSSADPTPAVDNSTGAPASAVSLPTATLIGAAPTSQPGAPSATPAPDVPATVGPASDPTAEPTAVPRAVITLSEPATGSSAKGIVHIKGEISITPFEKALVAEVRDGEGQILGQIGILTSGDYGGPGAFETDLTFNAPASLRPGSVVVYDTDEADGSLSAEASVPVQLNGAASGLPALALPAAGSMETLPLHVEAVDLEPDAAYTVQVQWIDGTVLEQPATALSVNGRGVLAANVDWATESAPPNPPTQDAVVNLLNAEGTPVASSSLRIINRSDSGLVQPVKVYFVLGEQLQEFTRWVPSTPAIATAALRELSWGPAGNELAAAGASTALATPEEIAAYPQQDGWSGRAYLRSLRITDGVAYVDWSSEMRAWGGGSTRLGMLQQQVEQTLLQFPTISSVEQTIDGSADALQP